MMINLLRSKKPAFLGEERKASFKTHMLIRKALREVINVFQAINPNYFIIRYNI